MGFECLNNALALRLVLKPASGTGVLRVRFPAQQIIEYAALTGIDAPMSAAPAFW